MLLGPEERDAGPPHKVLAFVVQLGVVLDRKVRTSASFYGAAYLLSPLKRWARVGTSDLGTILMRDLGLIRGEYVVHKGAGSHSFPYSPWCLEWMFSKVELPLPLKTAVYEGQLYELG